MSIWEQDEEYRQCLRIDIEREIRECELLNDKLEKKRCEIEEHLISECKHEDYEVEKCSLSPRSLRLKRLSYFEPKINKFEMNTDVQEPEQLDTNLVDIVETTKNITENSKVLKKAKARCLGQTRAKKRCLNMCVGEYCHKHKLSRKDSIDTV